MKQLFKNIKLFKMSKLFYSKQFYSQSVSSIRKRSLVVIAALLISAFHNNSYAQCIAVTKNLLGVAPPSSGIAGRFNATFEIIVTNTCPGNAVSVDVIDALASYNGSGFVSVVGAPVVAYESDPVNSNPGIINFGFTGIAPNDNLTDGSGIIENGDTIIYHITAEFNPYAIGAILPLSNAVIATYGPAVPEDSSFSNVVVIPDCWTNCQMSCNNQVNISVNGACQADIVSSMVLEGESETCADLGFYQVQLKYKGNIVPIPVDSKYIGKYLDVTIKNIVCGNSCWGRILIEDKTPPVMVCRVRDTISCGSNLDPLFTGFPVNIALVDRSVYPYRVNGIDACGSVSLTYRDSLVNYSCANDSLSATLYRRWCAVDASGHQVCCTDTIDLRRGTIADIILPPNYDGIAGADILLCHGVFKSNPNRRWTKLKNGLPDTSNTTGTGSPRGIYCGNIQFDFSDDTIQICPGSYKLLRKWLIIDWCRPNMRLTHIQQIKVVDEQPPIVTCPPNGTVLSTNPWSCTVSTILPVPTTDSSQASTRPYVIEGCSDWTYSVEHLPAINPRDCVPGPGPGSTANIVRLPDGRYQVNNMPLGCNWIYYIITDGCGNTSRCQFDYEVKDLTPPVAVCHQKTVVSIGTNTSARIPASVLSDRSHDNCGVVSFKAARMFRSSCGTTQFRDSVEFCCDDVARDSVLVRLLVSDAAGNTSECMVSVIVQDKLPPSISCPPNFTVNCTSDLTDLSRFGTATATDNCGATVRDTVRDERNSCGLGKIFRVFTARDGGNLTRSCTQQITVVDSFPFVGSYILWPSDITLNGCLNINTKIDATGKPRFINQDRCNQLAINHEDLVFNIVEDACIKILRKWTVIDWCRYDPTKSGDSSGTWVRTQVIKVNNTEPPIFTSNCNDGQQFCITSGCSASITLEATALDSCTNQSDLRWTYKLFESNGVTLIASGVRNRFTRNLAAGTYIVEWTVEDLCGNKNVCRYSFVVRDCKQPTPYCVTGIVTVLMDRARNVTIWAKDFNVNSEDNCTPKSRLLYSFTSNVRDSSRTFTCADIANGVSDTVDVSIYVTDEAGNQDVCHTKVILQDNNDVCPNRNVNTANIAGLIKLNDNEMAPKVPVILHLNGGGTQEQLTGINGQYAFTDLPAHAKYTIKPELDENYLDGVTTKDIVKIQRHILGIDYLNSPYKLLAADVNRSKTITAKDMADIRKLILGINTKFVNNKSWNFIDASCPITMDNAYQCRDYIEINSLNKDMMENNFVAIKIGDVTGEARTGVRAAQPRNRQSVEWLIDLDVHTKEEVLRLPVYSNSAIHQLAGFQLALANTADDFEFMSIEPAAIKLLPEHYHIHHTSSLVISWTSAGSVDIKPDEVMFYIVGRQSGNKSPNLVCSTYPIHPELYTTDQDVNINIKLKSRMEEESDINGYELFQNIPNPFTSQTSIYYTLPADEDVELHLYECSGKHLLTMRQAGSRGLNRIDLNVEHLNLGGVLYYRLEAKGFNATRKMVVLK